MVLNHAAAILIFSGPLFYIGLWMALDPELPAGLFRMVAPAAGGRLQNRLRIAGVALMLLAIVL